MLELQHYIMLGRDLKIINMKLQAWLPTRKRCLPTAFISDCKGKRTIIQLLVFWKKIVKALPLANLNV